LKPKPCRNFFKLNIFSSETSERIMRYWFGIVLFSCALIGTIRGLSFLPDILRGGGRSGGSSGSISTCSFLNLKALCERIIPSNLKANQTVCAFDPATSIKCPQQTTAANSIDGFNDVCSNDAQIMCANNEVIKIHRGVIGLKDSGLCPSSLASPPSSFSNWCDETIQTTKILSDM
jgi:hypothetical protein